MVNFSNHSAFTSITLKLNDNMKTRFASDYKYLGFGKHRTTNIVELDNGETDKRYSYSINSNLKRRDIIISIAILLLVSIVVYNFFKV